VKALVAFGTKYGSTAEVAEEIAKVLRSKGADTDVVDLRGKMVKDVSSYDLVVAGSSINVGAWTKESQSFLESNCATMRGKKVALFACCGDVVFQKGPIEESRKKYLEDVAAKYSLNKADMALFGGVLDFSKYGFLVKAILNGAKKDFERKGVDTSKPYDFRDWDQIRSWAGSLV